jgi:hypothetical protein
MKDTRLTDRDFEDICAYLDGELPENQRRQFAQRLQQEPQLKAAYEALSRTKVILRTQSKLRAPRNYTLTAEQAAKAKSFWSYRLSLRPLFQTASALASAVLALAFLFNLIAFQMGVARPMMVAEPAQPEAVLQEAAPTQVVQKNELPMAPQEAPTEAAPMAKAVPDATEGGGFPYPGGGEMGGMGGGEGAAPSIAEAPLTGVYTDTLMAPLSETVVSTATALLEAEQPAPEIGEPYPATVPPGERSLGTAGYPPPEAQEMVGRKLLNTFWLKQALLGFLALGFGGAAIYLRRRKV